MTVADFSGYVTKFDIECTDGRTIRPEAFKHMDGVTVPLVWSHGHKDPKNVLGHVKLEYRTDGVYGYGFFNDTDQGENSKKLVKHEDIKALSIFATRLKQRAMNVIHGMINEVSLCLAGANSGAVIDNITIAHSDGYEETLDDSAIINFGLALEHVASDEEVVEHSTVQEVYDTLTDEQKEVVNYMVGAALEDSTASHSDVDPDEEETEESTDNAGEQPDGGETGDTADTDEENLGHQEGTSDMTRNVFEQNGGTATVEKHELTHDALTGIFDSAEKGGSLKHAVEEYALAHGIHNIETLFPEAKNLTSTPEWNKRRTEWVAKVLGGVGRTPFSRVRSVVADITMEEARALGYIKGNFKKEEWFSVSARTTTPTTIYKKQKLDRDDVIDITDFDVIAWMKGEMRMMLEEEIARAILIGDGRPVEDPANPGDPNPDKIKDPAGASSGAGVRSILNDHELYVTTVNVNVDDASSSMIEVSDTLVGERNWYRGSGQPTLYTTNKWVSRMMVTRDTQNRRLWRTKAELAQELDVDEIVEVEVMETVPDLFGIIVNLRDYNIGADKGGEVNLFDDFDIDYNQLKYLIETRISGALTKIKSAIVVRAVAAAKALIVPTPPTFVSSTGVITIPTQTGTVYKNADTGATLTAGAQTALAAGASLTVRAVATGNYYYKNNAEDEFTFTRDAA